MFSKLPLLAGILLLATSTACHKSDPVPAVQEFTFEIKTQADGMRNVRPEVGCAEKSQTVGGGSPILTAQLGTDPAPNNVFTTVSTRYHSGDQVVVYVKFPDITSSTNWPPAANGYAFAGLYVNGNPVGRGVRLGYNEYNNSPQLRYVDANGKTNLLLEEVITLP